MSTYKLEKKFSTMWEYRGIVITRQGASKTRTAKSVQPHYNFDITPFVTEQFTSRMSKKVTRFERVGDTLSEVAEKIDEMFDNGDLA